jgi:hypothetical protein
MTAEMPNIRRNSAGSIDFDFYRQRAQQERNAYMGAVLSRATPSFSPQTKRKASLLAAALLVATGAFWATMLTSPPQVEASLRQGIDIARMSAAADPNMEGFEDRYQRHTGILDVLSP